MKTKEQLLTPGWIDLSALLRYLRERGIEKERYGPRENSTDGEGHIVFRSRSGHVYEWHGNYYVAKSFADLLAWADDENSAQ